MSNFYCGHCGAACLDSETGYFTGCKHYPPDREPTEQEKRILEGKYAATRQEKSDE